MKEYTLGLLCSQSILTKYAVKRKVPPMLYLSSTERECAGQDIITIKEETRLNPGQQPAFKNVNTILCWWSEADS